MFRKKRKHMVEKRDRGHNRKFSAAIQVDLHLDIRFLVFRDTFFDVSYESSLNDKK